MSERKEESFAAELARSLADCPIEERKMVFVGVLNRHLPRRREAILVGGSLVEFYTSRAYVSGDVDLIGDRDAILELLTAARFERTGRVFVQEELALVADVVGSTLRPWERVRHFEIRGYRVPAVTPEDAIVDRLLADKFWDSRTDWEQAVLLLGALEGRLDMAVLEENARANNVADRLSDIISQVATGRSPSRTKVLR